MLTVALLWRRIESVTAITKVLWGTMIVTVGLVIVETYSHSTRTCVFPHLAARDGGRDRGAAGRAGAAPARLAISRHRTVRQSVPGVPGVYPALAGGPWLCRTLVLSTRLNDRDVRLLLS